MRLAFSRQEKSRRRKGDWFYKLYLGVLTKYGAFPPHSRLEQECTGLAQLSEKLILLSCPFQMSDGKQESEVIYWFSSSINNVKIMLNLYHLFSYFVVCFHLMNQPSRSIIAFVQTTYSFQNSSGNIF